MKKYKIVLTGLLLLTAVMSCNNNQKLQASGASQPVTPAGGQENVKMMNQQKMWLKLLWDQKIIPRWWQL